MKEMPKASASRGTIRPWYVLTQPMSVALLHRRMRGDAGAEGVEVVGHHDLVARRSTEVTAPAR